MHKKLSCRLKAKGRCFSATDVKLVRETLRVCTEIYSPRKKTDIKRAHHWFPREMTSEEQAQKFHTDDVLTPGFKKCFRGSIARFTVTGGNEAGVDLVLIQTSLLYYVNHVVLMLTSIFKHNFHKKRKEVCIKTSSTSASHSLSGKETKPTTVKWPIKVSGKLPTYPTPNPRFCSKWQVSVNADLGEG